MIVAIHQPNYMPYTGFFDKLDQSDVFVLLDTVQFVKGGWQNRNRIKGQAGAQWLTVPVKHRFGQRINEVGINGDNWRRKHWLSLLHNYGSSLHWDYVASNLEVLYCSNAWRFLYTLNVRLIEVLAKILDIKTPMPLASELGLGCKDSSKRLLNICKHFGATTYLSGPSGRRYLNVDAFKLEGVAVEFQSYKPPVYEQCYGDFCSGLGVVDLLANCGPNALNVLRGGRR